MANDVPDFTRSVEVSAGTLNANITNAAIIVEPASGATFPISGTVNATITNSQIAVVPASGSTFNAHITDSAVTIQPASGATFPITGPVTVNTAGGPVYVNAAGTPITEGLLAYQTGLPLGTGYVVAYQGAVDTYESLLICAESEQTDFRVSIEWDDPTGTNPLPYYTDWDVPQRQNFAHVWPLPTPYVQITFYGTPNTVITTVAIYGLRTPAPPPVLQAIGPLAEGRSVSIAAGASYYAMLLPYAGQASINVWNGASAPCAVSVIPQDHLGNLLGQCFYYNGSALTIRDVFGLPPHINKLRIDNNDTATHTYHFSVTAI